MKSDTDGLLVKELTYWLATTWLTLTERESECVFAARAMLCDRCMTLVIGVRLLVFFRFLHCESRSLTGRTMNITTTVLW